MKSTSDLRNATDGLRVHLGGMVRRLVVTATSKALWKLAGFVLLDKSREELNAEPFTGIGFFARPPSSGKPEAIVLMLGDDARTPIAVAVRDEKTRQAIVGALKENETAMFNSLSVVHIKDTGTVHLGDSNAVDAAVKGTTYRAAEDAMLTAVSAAIALISNIPGLTAPQLAIVTAATAAITAFQAAAATYLATKVRVS